MNGGVEAPPRKPNDDDPYRAALDAAGLGVWDWNVVDDELTYSPALGPLLGLKRGESHRNLSAFLKAIAPCDRDRVRLAVLERADTLGVDFGLESTVAPDGRLSLRGQVRRDIAGDPIRIVGIVIDVSEQARSESQLRLQTNLAELRGEIGSTLTRSGHLDEIAQESAVKLAQRLDAAFVRIWLLDPAEGVLRLHASSELHANLDGPHDRIPVGRFMVGRIAESGKPLSSNEVQNDDTIGDREWAIGHGIVAFSGHPLIVDDHVVGVLGLFSRTVFPQVVLQAITSIADDLASCIERKRSEGELRRNEARKAAILESALDCIITIDHFGQIIEFNPAAERTFGYRRKDALGRSLRDLIVPVRYREAHGRGIALFLDTGKTNVIGQRIEIKAVRADGIEILVELAITLVRQDGPPVFTAYLRDITEQHRVAKVAREAEDRTRAILEAIPDLMFRIDKDGVYVDYRAAIAEDLAHPPETFLGKTFTNYYLLNWPRRSSRRWKPRPYRARSRRSSTRSLASTVCATTTRLGSLRLPVVNSSSSSTTSPIDCGPRRCFATERSACDRSSKRQSMPSSSWMMRDAWSRSTPRRSDSSATSSRKSPGDP